MTTREAQLRMLSQAYDVALRQGLRPVWHPDYRGFTFDCPGCRRAGRTPHRVTMPGNVRRWPPPVA